MAVAKKTGGTRPKKKATAQTAKALQARSAAKVARAKAEKSGALADQKAATVAEEKADRETKLEARERFERVAGLRVQAIIAGMRALRKIAPLTKYYFEPADLQLMFTSLDAEKNLTFEAFNAAVQIKKSGPVQKRFTFAPLPARAPADLGDDTSRGEGE